MANVHVALTRVSGQGSDGGAIQATDAIPLASELVVSGAASVQSTIELASLTSQYRVFWVVTPIDGNIWVGFGENPTATAGEGWYVAQGQSRAFFAKNASKMAVIDA